MSSDSGEAPRASTVPLNLLIATYMLTRKDGEQEEQFPKNLLKLESINRILSINKNDNKIKIEYNENAEFLVNKIIPEPRPIHISSWYESYNTDCYIKLSITNLILNISNCKVILTVNKKSSSYYDDYDVKLNVLLHCEKKEKNHYDCSVTDVSIDLIPVKDIILEVSNELMLWLLILLLDGDAVSMSTVDSCDLLDKKPYEATILAKAYRSYDCSLSRGSDINVRGYIVLPKCIENIIITANTIASNIADKINELANLKVDDILNLLPNPKIDYVRKVINDTQLDTYKMILSKLSNINTH